MTFKYSCDRIFRGGVSTADELVVADGVVRASAVSAAASRHFENCVILPGFVDVHVHLREPGFSYKETIVSGTASAARGGYTAVGAMPNLKPVPDSADTLAVQEALIEEGARIRVLPYGAITAGQNGERLADMAAMADRVIAFSDDGRGVQSPGMMREAMQEARRLGKIIAAHCEDETLLHGGKIHDGEYARTHGIPGICSESEWRQIERDLELAAETGAAYHICHISTKESVELIRRAKAAGVDVSCETAPHYLLLDDSMLQDKGRFRMNPPIRAAADREALIEGLLDGTVDMIATDHAPHSAEEKAGGLRNSLNGVVGLETAFPVLYTGLVKPGIISLERLVELMHTAPKTRFGIPGGTEINEAACFNVFELASPYTIDPREFLSLGKSSPFEGMTVYGRCLMTVYNGNIVWEEKENA